MSSVCSTFPHMLWPINKPNHGYLIPSRSQKLVNASICCCCSPRYFVVVVPSLQFCFLWNNTLWNNWLLKNKFNVHVRPAHTKYARLQKQGGARTVLMIKICVAHTVHCPSHTHKSEVCFTPHNLRRRQRFHTLNYDSVTNKVSLRTETVTFLLALMWKCPCIIFNAKRTWMNFGPTCRLLF